MAERHRVVWLHAAVFDLEESSARIDSDAPLRTPAIVERILRAGDSLAKLPARGRIVPELSGIGVRTYLEIQVPPWRIIYKRAGRSLVEIHAIIDGRRDVREVLANRLVLR